MAKDSSVYIATETGSAEIKGQTYTFYKDVTRVRGDHPLVKTGFFAPAEDSVHYEVEQATAAPGEKRGAK